MNILWSALIGAIVGGASAALIWAAGKYMDWGPKTQRIAGVIAFAVTMAAIRAVPTDRIAESFKSPDRRTQEADRALMAQPAYAAMRQYYPSEYAKIRDSAVASIQSGKSELEAINEIRPIYLALVTAQIPKASDETLSRLLDITLKQTGYLDSVNPRYCYELVTTPERLSFNMANVIPADLANAELEISATALRESSVSPAPAAAPLPEAAMTKIAQEALLKLSATDIQNLDAVNFEPRKITTEPQMAAFCHFTRSLLQEIAVLPRGQSGKVYRQLIAMK